MNPLHVKVENPFSPQQVLELVNSYKPQFMNWWDQRPDNWDFDTSVVVLVGAVTIWHQTMKSCLLDGTTEPHDHVSMGFGYNNMQHELKQLGLPTEFTLYMWVALLEVVSTYEGSLSLVLTHVISNMVNDFNRHWIY